MNLRAKGISVPAQMLIALVLGVLTGILVPGVGSKLAFLVTIFGHAIKMVVMPLILLSVTVGVFKMARGAPQPCSRLPIEHRPVNP